MVNSIPFKNLRSFNDLNTPNLHLSAKINKPELLIIDKKIPNKTPIMNPINPIAHRITPIINPNRKYKSVPVFFETQSFIICKEVASYCFVNCKP